MEDYAPTWKKLVDILGISDRMAQTMQTCLHAYYNNHTDKLRLEIVVMFKTLLLSDIITEIFNHTTIYFMLEEHDTIDDFIDGLRKLKD